MAANTYTAFYHNIAVTAAQDLIELTAPSDAALEVIRVFVGQYQDSGDAEAESLRLNIVRYASSGSGGLTADIGAHQAGQVASAVTAERNNTTPGGTPTRIHASTWSVGSGWLHEMEEEEAIWVSPSDILAVSLPAAPADQLGVSVSVTWREWGG